MHFVKGKTYSLNHRLTPKKGLDGIHIGSHFHKNAYMHEQTIEFGVRIVGRKNLNGCTPFSGIL